MSIRRILMSTALVVLALTVSTAPVLAQFTPRFSQQTRRAPGQMHIGMGTNVLNLGDYTSEPWPQLEAGIGLLHARLGFAIPLSGEKWFVLTEVEAQLGQTTGEFVPPYNPSARYEITTIKQRGFSIMANITRATSARRVLYGAGIGYHLLTHDPLAPADMQTAGDAFLRDPFVHLGLGGQLFYAHQIGRFNDTTMFMLEGRYKAAIMGGNIPGSSRKILLSEFQITLLVAAK